jgi:hypothetical protein
MDISEPLKVAVAATLVESLTDEAKNKLIGDAIQKLIEPERDNKYGSRNEESALDKIFQSETHTIAREVVRDLLQPGTDARAKIAAVVSKGVERFLLSDDALSKIAGTIASQMESIIWETAKRY